MEDLVRIVVDTTEGQPKLKGSPKTMIDLMREEMLRRGRGAPDKKPVKEESTAS